MHPPPVTPRQNLGKRPWAIDNFDAFSRRLLGGAGNGEDYTASNTRGSNSAAAAPAPSVPGLNQATPGRPPYKRAMMFVDNSGADIVLGMLPLARELLRLGCEVGTHIYGASWSVSYPLHPANQCSPVTTSHIVDLLLAP